MSIETSKNNFNGFFYLIGASVFSLVLRGFGGDRMVENLITNISGGPQYSLFCNDSNISSGIFFRFLQIIFVIIPIVGPSPISMGLILSG